MHMTALERAGLVKSEYKTVGEGKRQRKYFKVVEFEITLTPEKIREIVERGESG